MIDYHKNFKILFISSSEPSPVMLERIKIANFNNKTPLLISWNRNDFYNFNNIYNFEKITYNIGPINNLYKRFIKVFNFYKWLKIFLITNNVNDIDIFCDSFDILIVTILLKKKFKIYIRYCVEDLHKLQLNDNIYGKIFRKFERYVHSNVDLLIVTSQKFIECYYINISKSKYIIVENLPNKIPWQNFKRQKSKDDKFKIAFIGIIRYFNCLQALVDSSRVLYKNGHNFEVSFIGNGDDYDRLIEYCKNDTFISFTGTYNYNLDISRLYSDVDLIYSVYDYNIKNVKLAMPNKFYESLITKIPIIVSRNTYLEKRVTELGIGIGVDYKNIQDLTNLLTMAINKNNWYTISENSLINYNNINNYYNDNEKLMNQSILEY
jgi:succinoglycan biosynthesis protein ExoL